MSRRMADVPLDEIEVRHLNTDLALRCYGLQIQAAGLARAVDAGYLSASRARQLLREAMTQPDSWPTAKAQELEDYVEATFLALATSGTFGDDWRQT